MYSILTECPLFRGLTADQIEELIGSSDRYSIRKYNSGEVIARRDTSYSGLMIILSGKVSGDITYNTGKHVHVDTIEAPQLIAPAFLFGGYNRMPIDVISETDAEIMILHRGLIFELMQENMLVLSNFIDIISNRANAWSKKIFLLSYKTLKAKVASYLLNHSTEASAVVPIPSVGEIADYFSSTRRSLQTVLEGLEKKGYIELSKEQIVIKNRAALGDILKEE